MRQLYSGANKFCCQAVFPEALLRTRRIRMEPNAEHIAPKGDFATIVDPAYNSLDDFSVVFAVPAEPLKREQPGADAGHRQLRVPLPAPPSTGSRMPVPPTHVEDAGWCSALDAPSPQWEDHRTR